MEQSRSKLARGNHPNRIGETNMSQIVLAHILSKSQLEEYASNVLDGDDGFPDETTELQPFFGFDAPVMVALEVMLEEHFDDGLGLFSDHVQSVREASVPLLLAFHVTDRERVVPILEQLAADPDALTHFYEEFFAEEWVEAGTAMLEACRFVQSGLERLSSDRCWLLIFVS
jgi:hypothetical protein